MCRHNNAADPKNGCTTKPNTTATQKERLNCLTSILGGKLPHCSRQALVELMFSGDKGFADGLLAEAEHAAMSPHLVHERLEHHPFLHVTLLVLQLILLLFCICGFQCLSLHSWTHPPLALATPLWALDSSLTHTQFGGGPIWQGQARTHKSTADSQKTGCVVVMQGIFSSRLFPRCFWKLFCDGNQFPLRYLSFFWSKIKRKKKEKREEETENRNFCENLSPWQLLVSWFLPLITNWTSTNRMFLLLQ